MPKTFFKTTHEFTTAFPKALQIGGGVFEDPSTGRKFQLGGAGGYWWSGLNKKF